jgi:putative DNA primase/helicase
MAAGFVPDPSLPSILELAIMLWGQPTGWSHDRNEARFGAKESKSVLIAELVWRDHEAGTGGGYLAMHKLALGGLPEVRTPGGGKGGGTAPGVGGSAGGSTGGSSGAAKANGHTAPGKAANGHAGKVPPWQNIGKRYGYLDAAGHLVLEVVRTLTGSPRFLQRRPDPTNRSGWKWSLKDIPRDARPLYRLPELLASGSETTWICEGEKDADSLAALGLIATTAIGGTGGGWRAAYNGYFAGKPVVILPDNDPPGRAHAAIVARALFGVASSVKVLALPGLPEKGDVTDWLADGGDRSELEWLALEAPLYVPPGTYSPGVAPSGGAGAGGAGGEPELDGDIAFAEAEAEIDEGGGETETEAGIGPIGPEPPPPEGPRQAGRPAPDGLPVIICAAGELPRMVREAEAALLNAGAPIYQRSVLVRPAEQEYPAADGSVTHSAALVPIAPAAMMALLASVAIWQKWDGRSNRFVACDPPTKVIEILLANRGEWSFPVVRGVLTSPTIRPDGSLLMTPGYDPLSRYYLMFPSDLVMPEIPEAPTIQDAFHALARLESLLTDYDFVDDGDVSRSVALAILMTQVLRCGMAVSPLLAVSATAPGSGKSHLVDLASTIAIGRPCPIMGAGKNDEETEKGINTNLLSGVAGFSIDNVHRMVDLAVLNIATERPMIGIRLFGTLDKVEVENSVTIYMTGNNLPIVDEQVRRTVLCSMDSGEERPEQRQFDGDPIATVRADRGRYIADILIIARAYLAHGSRRDDMKPFGSYPGWSRLVREPLIWLGQPDPVASQNTTRASDPEMSRVQSVTAAWHFAFGDHAHPANYAIRFALTSVPDPDPDLPSNHPTVVQFLQDKEKRERLREVLLEAFPGRTNEIDSRRFGDWLRKYSNRIADHLRFSKDGGTTQGAARWRVTRV